MTDNDRPIDSIDCVLVADRHHGLSEGVRGLLEMVFKVVIMVADETSLIEGARRLRATVAIVDMSLTRDGIGVVRRLRAHCPHLKLIVLSIHDEINVCEAAMASGADGFVLKRSIATDLLPAVDAVRAGRSYASPAISKPQA